MAAIMQNKRKRESQDMAGGRPAPGMHQTPNDFEQHYLQTDDDGMDNADGVMDFAAAFAQHGADPTDTTNQQQDAVQTQAQGGDGGQSASDTAAAAIAQYHTMTVPQSTEQSFMTQATDGGDKQANSAGDQAPSSAQQRTSSFSDFDVSANQASPNGETSPTALSNPNGPKPAVGTEEWHKVRRDNHKEGMFTNHIRPNLLQLLILLQSSVAGVKQLTRASTSSPRSSRAARRTKAASSRAPYNSSPSSRRTRRRTSRSGRSRSCLRSKPSPSSALAATSSKPSATGRGRSASSGRKPGRKPVPPSMMRRPMLTPRMSTSGLSPLFCDSFFVCTCSKLAG